MLELESRDQADPNQADPNWIKICQLLILLTYKYPILFCKMANLFSYLFIKNEILKSFFEIHFLIKFGSDFGPPRPHLESTLGQGGWKGRPAGLGKYYSRL